MKKKSILTAVGVALYILTTMVDRYLWKLPDPLGIALIVIAFLLLLTGIIKNTPSK